MRKNRLLASLLISSALAVGLTACHEKVDTNARYVFRFDTALSYLERHEAYSQYAELLRQTPISMRSQSTVAQLLSARGHYTVFAPMNEAIDRYLWELSEEDSTLMRTPSWDGFRSDEKRDSVRQVVVLNSIIDSGDANEAYLVSDFPVTDKAEIPLSNMNDRKLSVNYSESDTLFINGSCPLDPVQRDIYVANGIIHQMHRVIAPKDITAALYLQDILDHQTEGYLVMAKAIQACGLMDTLSKIRDERYEELYQLGVIPDRMQMYIDGYHPNGYNWTPPHRKYGFTIFAETDEFWRSQGLDPLAPSDELLPRLVRWIEDNRQYSRDDVYTTDEHYASEQNLLYQWTTYHILPFRAPADRLVFHINEFGYSLNLPGRLSIPMYEIYTTMGKRRLLKIYESAESKGVFLNRFATLDSGPTGNYHETGCDADKVGCRVGRDSEQAVLSDIINCCIYPIDAPLSYNDNVRDNLARQRLRFDGMSLFPEAMNNEIRLKASTDERDQDVYIPCTAIYNYFENMQMNEQTRFVYLNAYKYNWRNLHSDEMKAKGRFELTFKLPPVPRRTTYELRYDVLPTNERGIQQFYFGSDPQRLAVTGIPVDLTRQLQNMNVGYERDTEDWDYNAEVDKRLRNNGVLKGAKSVTAAGSADDCERTQGHNTRYIILRQTLDPDKTYYLRLKTVLDSELKEFYMDYMEWCPKEVYDNPETPEDIW